MCFAVQFVVITGCTVFFDVKGFLQSFSFFSPLSFLFALSSLLFALCSFLFALT